MRSDPTGLSAMLKGQDCVTLLRHTHDTWGNVPTCTHALTGASSGNTSSTTSSAPSKSTGWSSWIRGGGGFPKDSGMFPHLPKPGTREDAEDAALFQVRLTAFPSGQLVSRWGQLVFRWDQLVSRWVQWFLRVVLWGVCVGRMRRMWPCSRWVEWTQGVVFCKGACTGRGGPHCV
jgi:hypothetical protein